MPEIAPAQAGDRALLVQAASLITGAAQTADANANQISATPVSLFHPRASLDQMAGRYQSAEEAIRGAVQNGGAAINSIANVTLKSRAVSIWKPMASSLKPVTFNGSGDTHRVANAFKSALPPVLHHSAAGLRNAAQGLRALLATS